MRKPAFCICKNKEADQLRIDSASDQRLCFRYIDSAILPKSEMSNLVGNPEDRFSHYVAHFSLPLDTVKLLGLTAV